METLQHLLSSLFRCLTAPAVKKKKRVFFSLCPLLLTFSLGTTEKSLASLSSLPSLGNYTHCQDSLLHTEQPYLSQPLLVCQILQSLNYLCGLTFTELSPLYPCLELRSPNLGQTLQICLTTTEQKTRVTFDLLAMLCFACSPGCC